MAIGRRRSNTAAKAASVFSQLEPVPITHEVGDQYGQLKRELERQGTPLNENDLWIAATALAHDAVLVTRDQHFARVPGLTVEDWTQTDW